MERDRLKKIVYWVIGLILIRSSVQNSLLADDKEGIGFKIEKKVIENAGRKRIALLVGVKESKSRDFDSLANAESDIAEIERNLVQKGDFTVVKFNSNPKLSDVTGWLDKAEIPEGSVFLFFFSGHGEMAADGSTWMYMHDSDLKQNKEKTVLKESELLDKLYLRNQKLREGNKKKFDIILFINACRKVSEETKTESSSNFKKRVEDEKVSRFYSAKAGAKAIDSNDKSKNNLSLFTFRFVQAINNSAIQKNEKGEEIKSSESKEADLTDSAFLGADSTVNGGNGDRKITLIEIRKFMEKVFESDKENKQMLEMNISDGMQDFPLVDLNKSYNIWWRYIVPSAAMPGWGELNYGRDYNERISGKISYYQGYLYPLIFAGLIGKTAADFKVYSARQNAFNNQSIIPAQPFGQDTFIFNFFIMNDKKSELKQATARYNDSAGLLLGFWLFNLAQSGLVPYLNNAYSDVFSFQMDIRPVYNDQRLYANSGSWERHTSFGLNFKF